MYIYTYIYIYIHTCIYIYIRYTASNSHAITFLSSRIYSTTQ